MSSEPTSRRCDQCQRAAITRLIESARQAGYLLVLGSDIQQTKKRQCSG